MTRLLYPALVVALATGIGIVSAQNNSGDAGKDPSVSGVVTAVTATNVTVAVGREKIIFGVDSSTSLVGWKATMKNDLVYRGPQTLTLTSFVTTGDHVTITFRQSDSRLIMKVLRLDRR